MYRTTTDPADFTRAAIAEVAKSDRARLVAELAAAADFDRWDDEFWRFVSGPDERVA